MAGMFKEAFVGLKRLMTNNPNPDDNATVEAGSSKRTRRSMSPEDHQNQPRTKRARTQTDLDDRQITSPKSQKKQSRSARRSSPDLGPSASPTVNVYSQQRTTRQQKPSADEERLVPGNYTPRKDSVPIHVPTNEWVTGMHDRKKQRPGAGKRHGVRNTLGAQGPSLVALDTVNSRGSNVVNYSVKRQKTSHIDQAQNDEPRSILTPPATLGNPPSVISNGSQSQSQEQHSQRLNSQVELRDVHRLLGGDKKKCRKPKSGSASSPSLSAANIETLSIPDDDDDDILVVEERPVPRVISDSKPARTNRDAYSSRQPLVQDSQPEFEVEGQFSRTMAATQQSTRSQMPTRPGNPNPSPRLNSIFKRDRGEPHQTRLSPQTHIRAKDRMQASPAAQRRLSAQDESEDELSLSTTAVQSPQKLKQTSITRQLSPSYIEPSLFSNKAAAKINAKIQQSENITIPLLSLGLQAGRWTDIMMHLIYNPEFKLLRVEYNGEFLQTSAGAVLEMTSKHARQVYFCTGTSTNAAILYGAKDMPISKGRIWFDFKTTRDRDEFLAVLEDMSSELPHRRFDDVHFKNVCEAVKPFIKPDVEIQAMEHRQLSTRERARAVQNGEDVEEPASFVQQQKRTRISRSMKAEPANRPAMEIPDDYSIPPPTARTAEATPPRSSQRTRPQRTGKAVQTFELEPERWSKIHGIPSWDSPLVYPPVGTNRTTVDAEDIARLDDGEFLNDNLIMFWLRYLEEQNPHRKDLIHTFTTFFFSALTTTSSGKRGFNYDAVHRWTRQIDLFNLPVVVVPINVNVHWFLIIICNLDKLERRLDPSILGDDSQELTIVEQATTPVQSSVPNDTEIPESPPEMRDGDLLQGVERISLDASQEDELPIFGKLKPTARKGGKRQKPPVQKVDPDTPALLVLDSLGGSHAPEIKSLKQYIVCEGRDKRAMDFEYTVLKGVTARGLPQQTNFCDCGVYLLGYMEALLRDPPGFVRKIMEREADYQSEFVNFDPSKKRAEIRDVLLELGEQQKADKKQKKREAMLAKKAAKNKRVSRSSGTTGPLSSPMRHDPVDKNSRMVQSSPTKAPPQQMQQSSPPASSMASSLRKSSPAVVEDEMLFGKEDSDNYDRVEYDDDQDDEQQDRFGESRGSVTVRPSSDGEIGISTSESEFHNQLLQVIGHANQAEHED